MAGPQVGLSLNDEEVALFLEQYWSRLDTVYRFLFVLTLSNDGALKLTQRVYDHLVDEFARLPRAADPLAVLVGHTWKVFMEKQGAGFKESSGSLAKTFKGLSIEERAAVYSVDVLSMDGTEAAKLLGTDPINLRRCLARGRRTLMGQRG